MAAELQPALTALEPRGPGIAEYLGVFQRRPGLIVIPLALTTALGALVAYMVPPKYESYTRFKVKDPSISKEIVGAAAFVMPHKHIVATMETDIKNRPFLQPIIEKIGLHEGFNVRDPEQQKKLFDYLNDRLAIKAGIALAGPDVIDIIYRGRDPRKVADFVNEVRDRWRDDFIKEYRDGAYVIVERSKAAVADIQRQLSQTRARYEAFIAQEPVDLVNQENEKVRQRGELFLQLANLESDIKEFEVNEKRISDQLGAEKPDLEERVKRPSKVKQDKLTARGTLTAALKIMTEDKKWTEKVPAVKEAMKQLQLLDAEIARLPDDEVESTTVVQNQVHAQLKSDRLAISRQLDAKRKLLGDRRSQLAELDTDLVRIPELRAKRAEFETAILDYGTRLSQQRIAYDRATNTWNSVSGKGGDLINVIEYARTEKKPVFPQIGLFIGIGAAVGALLGIGLAFLKEFSGMTFSTAEQVQSVLPVPVLGEVARIMTVAERRADTAGRMRRWIIVVVVVGILGTLHVFYFTQSLAKHLPRALNGVMDKIYSGK